MVHARALSPLTRARTRLTRQRTRPRQGLEKYEHGISSVSDVWCKYVGQVAHVALQEPLGAKRQKA